MTALYLDLTTGISGDMFMASLLDLGLSLEEIEGPLASLKLKGYELQVEETRKKGIRGLQFKVYLQNEEEEERNLSLITQLIQESELPERVKERAIQVFANVAQAEAWAHGTTIDKVHFHEVGAIDSIIDIVGVSLGLHLLEIEKVTASPIPLGHGFTMSRHGRIPVPAPATTYLLQGLPCYGAGIEKELVTPTGAALLRTIAKGFGSLPPMLLQRIGVGCGSRDLEIPNLLRAFLGQEKKRQEEGNTTEERVLVMTTYLDDLSPEILPYVRERLFLAGAFDVYITPTLMKKGRLGSSLQVLLPKERREEILAVLFEETSTLGVRIHEEERACLQREEKRVALYGQEIRVKIGKYRGQIINVAPEYRDCYQVAKETGMPLKEVYGKAMLAYHESKEGRHG